MCLNINVKYNDQNVKINILRKEDESGNIEKTSNCFKIYQVTSLLEQYLMSSFLNKNINKLDITIKDRYARS